MSTIKGYAVEDRAGALFINTVSGTERAAKVNYLVAERKVPVYNRHSNSEIKRMFNEASKLHGTRCVKVSITQDHDQ